jgi:hypothetical protein
MAKATSPSTLGSRWWQREPIAGLLIGWTVIVAGGAIGYELLQILERAL